MKNKFTRLLLIVLSLTLCLGLFTACGGNGEGNGDGGTAQDFKFEAESADLTDCVLFELGGATSAVREVTGASGGKALADIKAKDSTVKWTVNSDKAVTDAKLTFSLSSNNVVMDDSFQTMFEEQEISPEKVELKINGTVVNYSAKNLSAKEGTIVDITDWAWTSLIVSNVSLKEGANTIVLSAIALDDFWSGMGMEVSYMPDIDYLSINTTATLTWTAANNT